jgi:hypothetical protein
MGDFLYRKSPGMATDAGLEARRPSGETGRADYLKTSLTFSPACFRLPDA